MYRRTSCTPGAGWQAFWPVQRSPGRIGPLPDVLPDAAQAARHTGATGGASHSLVKLGRGQVVAVVAAILTMAWLIIAPHVITIEQMPSDEPPALPDWMLVCWDADASTDGRPHEGR